MHKKWLLVLIIAMFCLVTFISTLQAEEETAQKASTSITLKNDFVEPEEKESYHKQSASIYFHDGNWFGGGVNIALKPKYDYTEVKPYLTINKGPVYLLGGLSTDSTGSDYFQGGIWYVNTSNKLSVFLDLRNYWGYWRRNN